MIEERKIYVCTECGKTFENKVATCAECSKAIRPGKVVGPFRVIKKTFMNGKYVVECLLCGYEATVGVTNLKRQKSCGCKPRHIETRSVTEHSVRYYCSRCGKVRVEEPPVLEWCCMEEE
jgi:DNA-directed RNA polymerase subunit RPC12/RpoP